MVLHALLLMAVIIFLRRRFHPLNSAWKHLKTSGRAVGAPQAEARLPLGSCVEAQLRSALCAAVFAKQQVAEAARRVRPPPASDALLPKGCKFVASVSPRVSSGTAPFVLSGTGRRRHWNCDFNNHCRGNVQTRA